MHVTRWKTVVRMMTILSFSYLSAVVTTMASVTEENSVDLRPHWKVGDKAHYEMIKTRFKSHGDRVLETTTRIDVVLEVLKATEQAYVLRWLTKNMTFDNPEQAKNPIVQQMANLFTQLPIVLKINSLGYIEGVENVEELQALSTKALNTMASALHKAGINQEILSTVMENARTLVNTMFATKEQATQVLTSRAVGLYFLVLGRTYTLSHPIEYTDKLPNPLGSEPFPSRGEFVLNAFDKALGLATITWKQAIDSKRAQQIMEKSLKEFALRLGKTMPEVNSLKSFTVEDKAAFSVDISSGWVHHLTHTRTTKIEAGLQKDTVTMTRKTK